MRARIRAASGGYWPVVQKRRSLPLLAVCGVLAACGGDDGGTAGESGGDADSQIKALVANLSELARAGEGGRICEEVFTEQLRLNIKETSGRRCGEEVTEDLAADDALFEVSDLSVDGEQATGVLVDQQDRRSNATFVLADEGWRISGIR